MKNRKLYYYKSEKDTIPRGIINFDLVQVTLDVIHKDFQFK